MPDSPGRADLDALDQILAGLPGEPPHSLPAGMGDAALALRDLAAGERLAADAFDLKEGWARVQAGLPAMPRAVALRPRRRGLGGLIEPYSGGRRLMASAAAVAIAIVAVVVVAVLSVSDTAEAGLLEEAQALSRASDEVLADGQLTAREIRRLQPIVERLSRAADRDLANLSPQRLEQALALIERVIQALRDRATDRSLSDAIARLEVIADRLRAALDERGDTAPDRLRPGDRPPVRSTDREPADGEPPVRDRPAGDRSPPARDGATEAPTRDTTDRLPATDDEPVHDMATDDQAERPVRERDAAGTAETDRGDATTDGEAIPSKDEPIRTPDTTDAATDDGATRPADGTETRDGPGGDGMGTRPGDGGSRTGSDTRTSDGQARRQRDDGGTRPGDQGAGASPRPPSTDQTQRCEGDQSGDRGVAGEGACRRP